MSTTGFVEVGEIVHYHGAGQPVRAAVVGHVHEDGRTCDLLVLMDGDGGELARQAWALGHSVTRVRLDIPYGDLKQQARFWTFRFERGRLVPQ